MAILFQESPWGASQSINIWRIPKRMQSLFVEFPVLCMLSAWCAKLVLKTCRLNFHSPNQSILKEVFLMACRNLNGRFQTEIERK